MNKITIAVDAMGGDFGPSVVVPAAIKVLESHKQLSIILVGDKDALQEKLQKLHFDKTRLTVQHASQQVEMDDSPAHALRTKKDSSMRVAINLVKAGNAEACVSAGNTGALMATARFVLKTIPGIDRPAIISTFPTIAPNKNMRMLDLGANVDSTAENLFQFAIMGSVLAAAVDNIKNPQVFLLNIGEEDIKGNDQVKKTAQLLANSNILNYQGYIEGDEIYEGIADIVVCDGFVGNVALKTSEGVSILIRKLIKEAYNRSFLTRIIGLFSLPILKSSIRRVDPDLYNGATLLGLKGIVIKSHGSANEKAFIHALEEAILQTEKNIPQLIRAEVEHLLEKSKTNSDININSSQL